jgi:hypothetical protein
MLSVTITSAATSDSSAGINRTIRGELRISPEWVDCGIAACPMWHTWQVHLSSSWVTPCEWATPWVAKAQTARTNAIVSSRKAIFFAMTQPTSLRSSV